MSEDATLKFKKSYAGSTSNVIKSVILGKADAGATLDMDLAKEPEEISARLRPILVTPKRPAHPLSAHPRVPARTRETIARAVLALGTDRSNNELLRSVRMPDPMAAEYDRDYRDLESIDIRTLTE